VSSLEETSAPQSPSCTAGTMHVVQPEIAQVPECERALTTSSTCTNNLSVSHAAIA